MLIAYIGANEGFLALAFEAAGRAEVVHVPAEPGEVAEALTRADGLLDASMKVRITDAMIDSAPKLRIISCATTGSDHIERRALNARGIPVRTLREDPDLLRNITPAAELSWALLMTCARRLKGAFRHVESGKWVREDFPGTMLNGRTLGLIGCGRIGGWMSRYAKAFGMRVLGHDPHQATLPEGVERNPLEDLVAEADFLSIHVHLTDETRGLLSRELLSRAKQGVVVINTSRGAVIDEQALIEGLESGRIGGAGLDVLEGEPDIQDHPLVELARRHGNVVITPHCGGFSPDAVKLVCAHAARKILNFLQTR